MNEICVSFTKNLLKFCTCFSKNYKMFDNMTKFRKVSNTIFKNFDKFVQFIKIEAEGSF